MEQIKFSLNVLTILVDVVLIAVIVRRWKK